MRIGIDGSRLCDDQGRRGAGIEHYSWSITQALLRVGSHHEFFLFVPKVFTASMQRQLAEGVSNVHFLRPILPRLPYISRHVFLPFRMRCSRLDLLFAPAGQIPFGFRGTSVATIHDVSIFTHPEWFPESFGQDMSTKLFVPNTIRRAKRLIAVSKATALNLHEYMPESVSKTRVIHEGVNPPPDPFIQDWQKKQDTKDLIVFLGTLEPRKNLLNAFHAFHEYLCGHPERARHTRFILAGKAGWKYEPIAEAIIEMNQAWHGYAPEGVIEHVGFVSEQEKWDLLYRADVLFFPSFEEGFGLPVLEAMSVGTPVITTPTSAICEVAGDCALYCDPEDVSSMASALAQCLLIPDGVKTLVIDAKKRAEQFSWQRAAEKTLEVFEEVWEV